jgi:REP element-mobilizing transposase RayT
MEKQAGFHSSPAESLVQQEKTTVLQPGSSYHIFNRGVNGQTIFLQRRNYEHFIYLYARHIQPVADTCAFCLLPNHFHLLIRVREMTGDGAAPEPRAASQAFSNLFNAYAKAINKAFRRTGPLFERPFKRIPVADEAYFARLVVYIHQNPQRHGLIDDYRAWPFSSYAIFTGDRPSFVSQDLLSAWFGDVQGYRSAHLVDVDAGSLGDLLEDE